jgi:hypothetical protein
MRDSRMNRHLYRGGCTLKLTLSALNKINALDAVHREDRCGVWHGHDNSRVIDGGSTARTERWSETSAFQQPLTETKLVDAGTSAGLDGGKVVVRMKGMLIVLGDTLCISIGRCVGNRLRGGQGHVAADAKTGGWNFRLLDDSFSFGNIDVEIDPIGHTSGFLGTFVTNFHCGFDITARPTYTIGHDNFFGLREQITSEVGTHVFNLMVRLDTTQFHDANNFIFFLLAENLSLGGLDVALNHGAFKQSIFGVHGSREDGSMQWWGNDLARLNQSTVKFGFFVKKEGELISLGLRTGGESTLQLTSLLRLGLGLNIASGYGSGTRTSLSLDINRCSDFVLCLLAVSHKILVFERDHVILNLYFLLTLGRRSRSGKHDKLLRLKQESIVRPSGRDSNWRESMTRCK